MLKALFVKNSTLVTIGGVATQRQDYLLQNRQNLSITRNLREWMDLTEDIDTTRLVTTKMIHTEMIEIFKSQPRIEIKFPRENWRQIWCTQSCLNRLGLDDIYLVLNDCISNLVKTRRHEIRNEQTPNSNVCGLVDDIDTNH
jgi:hypothetical protein